MKRDSDQYSEQETKLRLEKTMQGAFKGAPTPLKDIPKRDGESRSLERNQPRKRRRQRKKRASVMS